MEKKKDGMMEKKWNNGIVEECKDEKKMECWIDWSSPNIPLFQHSNCLWGYPLFQYSIIPTFRGRNL